MTPEREKQMRLGIWRRMLAVRRETAVAVAEKVCMPPAFGGCGRAVPEGERTWLYRECGLCPTCIARDDALLHDG